MKVKIYKSTPKGVLNAPSSKSYSHRYLIASGLANNPSIVSNIYFSNDVMASLNCLSSFGCAYKMDNNGVEFINNSYINDNPIFEGEVIAIDGIDASYKSYCRKCYNDIKRRTLRERKDNS